MPKTPVTMRRGSRCSGLGFRPSLLAMRKNRRSANMPQKSIAVHVPIKGARKVRPEFPIENGYTVRYVMDCVVCAKKVRQQILTPWHDKRGLSGPRYSW